MSIRFLKVKLKTLAAEARIIRHEERKLNGPRGRDELGWNPERESLVNHRKLVVRSEARHTLLAYGYLRGRSYRQLEFKCHQQPDWDKVERMVNKYGRAGIDNEFDHNWYGRDSMIGRHAA